MRNGKTGLLCVLVSAVGIGMLASNANASRSDDDRGGKKHHDNDKHHGDKKHKEKDKRPKGGRQVPTGNVTAALGDGEYSLGNHPDGNSATPFYGMVLNSLYRPKGSRKFTFDFDHEASDMRMIVDAGGSSIRIFGSVFGGRDIGDDWADDVYKGMYEIDFSYTSGLSLASGDNDLEVRLPASNSGIISTPLGDVFDLLDKANDSGRVFRLGDEDNDLGHRGFDGISGWGWLTGRQQGGRSKNVSGDFLFTVKPVPAPGTAVLGGLGLVCFTGRRRRGES